MIPILSRAEMRAFDAHAIESCHVPGVVLMENAGRGGADVIERELLERRARGRRIAVVCGTGNNGGDGFVVARHLATRGADVTAWLVGDAAKMTADCRVHHDAYVGIGGVVQTGIDELGPQLANVDVIVDALFGTGLDRAIAREPFTGVVHAIGVARATGRLPRVAALDVPSGLDADTGVALGIAIEADLTVSFAHLKLGHMTGHGARHCGPVHVVDIGVPPDLQGARSADLVESSDVTLRIAPRAVDAHKYRAGHVLVLAGSEGKVGAALLTARGVLRAGAGAATLLTWPAAARALEARIPEVMVRALPAAAAERERALDAALEGKPAIVIGPGFGADADARAVLDRVLARAKGVVVVDADALTLHAGALEAFAAAGGRAILTPHAGELARLLGRSSEEVEADRFVVAREAAKRSNATVVLKGAYTVVASADGRLVVSGSGSPALATAGAGDVLAGVVGALGCTLPPFEAAWCGAFVHGVAGRAWEKEHGDRGLLASEIADGVPAVLASLLA